MKKHLLIALFALFSLAANTVLAQKPTAEKQASVKISGEVITPLSVDESYLQQFKKTEVVRKDRDGVAHTYSGVVLAELLLKAGVTLGAELKGENLTKYVIAEASDGYQVVFALTELDKAFADRTIILADQVDGKPLAAGDGPFRIIIQDERKPARCIKQLTALRIMFAR